MALTRPGASARALRRLASGAASSSAPLPDTARSKVSGMFTLCYCRYAIASAPVGISVQATGVMLVDFQGRRQTLQVGEREEQDGRDRDAVEVLHVARRSLLPVTMCRRSASQAVPSNGLRSWGRTIELNRRAR